MSSIFGNWFGGNKEANQEPKEGGEAMTDADAPVSSGIEPALLLTSVKSHAPAEPPAAPLMLKPRYGIDDAIKLMRTLPVDENVDLVIRVIKNTLQSLDVRLADIIDDAGRRQESLSNAITEHETSILKLEREIETRRNEIAHLQDELAETSTVRERLELAEQLPVTPPSPRVTTSVVPTNASANASSRKSLSAAPQKPSAPPPVPNRPDTQYRPKMSSNDFKKGLPSPGENKPAESKPDDEDMPVESRDFVEKDT